MPSQSWTQFEDIIRALATTHIAPVHHLVHLPPDDNYVWSVQCADESFIIKIGPVLPYRIKREIRAYGHMAGNELPIPELIASGEHGDIPYLILSQHGTVTAQETFSSPDPAAPGIVTDILTGLYRISRLDSGPFRSIKNSVTTHDRDDERLEKTGRIPGLDIEHGRLLDRIAAVNADRHTELAHRDFSPRQVVMSGIRPVLIDFESIGPGLLERDIGDFIGGILKFGTYHPQYGDEIQRFADEHSLAHGIIRDYAIYSLLWSTTNAVPDETARTWRTTASRLIRDDTWLT